MQPKERIGRLKQCGKQTINLLKACRLLSESQKRKVIESCETGEESEIEKIIEEMVDGQRRLF